MINLLTFDKIMIYSYVGMAVMRYGHYASKCRLGIYKYDTHTPGFLITLKQPDAIIENFVVADTKLAAWILIR